MSGQVEISLEGVSVQFAMPVHYGVEPQTVISLLDTQRAFCEAGIPHEAKFECGGSDLKKSRDLTADNFLRSSCSHWFLFDSDVTWQSADALRLLALSTRLDCVCGIYPAKREPETWFLRSLGPVERNEFGCLPIGGAGAGFCVLSRKVMEAVAAASPWVRYHDRPHRLRSIFCPYIGADEWYRGEDIAFFERIRACGFSVWLDPTIQLGHVGPKEYRGDFAASIKPLPQGQDHDRNCQRAGARDRETVLQDPLGREEEGSGLRVQSLAVS